jgi:hypothetical protein
VSRWAVPVFVAFLGLSLGWMIRGAVFKPPVRTETKIVEKEVVRWAKSEATAVATSAAVEKKQSVRVVTRWLRPDGSLARERIREAATKSLQATATSSRSTATSLGQFEAARSSESRTVAFERPRLHLQGLLGLDLGNGLQRRWGAALSYRIAGPVTVGAWALPGARVGGASVGVTF